MSPITGIIFDFFGVFCPDIAWLWLAKNIPNLEDRREHYKELLRKVDLAAISFEEVCKVFGDDSGVTPQKVQVEIEGNVKIDQGVVAVLKDIKRKYPVGLLSNAPGKFLRTVLNEYELTQNFDAIVISSEVGLVKPDPVIFHYAVEQLKMPASQLLFIDDREVNTEAAKKAGMQSILYKNSTQLRAELAERGIVI